MAITIKDLTLQRRRWLDDHSPYAMKYWRDFDYSILENILWKRKSGRGLNNSYNDIIIMADTETSKKTLEEISIDTAYIEIKSELSKMTFIYRKEFSEIAKIFEFKDAGLSFSKNGFSKIDVYYEDIKERYPWHFPEAYSDLDALSFLYDFLIRNKPEVNNILDNHVCAWTISLRAFDRNLVTLYGSKPSEMVRCIERIHGNMKGEETFIYFHNLSYDYVFLRKFLYKRLGHPIKSLNIKSHVPIYLKFENGITLRDSLILAQRSLEKWAKDLDVEHQKAVGKWDYDLIRNQENRPKYTDDELEYIEHDTLAGVECLDKLKKALNKSIYSMPFTATGIPREESRERGKAHNAHEQFLKTALSYNQYLKHTFIFHGGYTHANRYFIDVLIDYLIQCYDFASSYPFVMLSEKFPMEAYTDYPNQQLKDILSESDDYSFVFKLVLINPQLKDYHTPMPFLQFSKCIACTNPVLDNGRILEADYVEIYVNEIDAEIINKYYQWDNDIECFEVEVAKKGYLPRWYTDYVFELFKEKTLLKGGDPVLYALAKAKLNSLYGMIAQRSIRDEIAEDFDTGLYEVLEKDPEALYEKYVHNHNSILPYQWASYVTSYATRNLFILGECCELWLYSDTDSVYGYNWDVTKINAYNEKCKEKIKANGYGCVSHNGREYWLGIAEHEDLKDDYIEFKTMGAKRYCGRCKADNELHITVAGVPKKNGAKCLKNDINNFTKGFIFDGETTGKLTHQYIYVDSIYIDEYGNETGDSVNLTSCDYLLDSTKRFFWEDDEIEEVTLSIYAEDEQINKIL